MYVCVCHAVTDRRIREAVAAGDTSFETLQDSLAVSTCCGCCEPEVREVLAECLGPGLRQRAELLDARHLPCSA